jgi:hypothetical protein
MNAPFPYFGGKRRAAAAIWERLGNVHNYVEPFCGSCAVLLARPTPPHIETVNDADGLLANFWRAMTQQPDEVARHADWPVNEADLVARQNWLVRERESLTARLMADPEWCDPKAAGWWVWGISAWIGGGFGEREVGKGDAGKLPEVDGAKHGRRVHAGKLPRVAGHIIGNGIQAGNATTPPSDGHQDSSILADTAARFRAVRVACGDWRRVLSPSTLAHKYVSSVGVVLDPPYDDGASVYAENNRVSADVRAWCLEHGDIPTLRIALCGYEGEHDELEAHGWSVLAWKAAGGYGNQSDGEGRVNSHRERVWFSPHCLSAAQGRLF